MALKVDKEVGYMGRVKELEKGARHQVSLSELCETAFGLPTAVTIRL